MKEYMKYKMTYMDRNVFEALICSKSVKRLAKETGYASIAICQRFRLLQKLGIIEKIVISYHDVKYMLTKKGKRIAKSMI